MSLDHETLRRWLIRARLWAGPKAGVRHRAYRERKARFGEMLQLDGSPHRWFGPHLPEACLMNIVDDATGTTLSLTGQLPLSAFGTVCRHLGIRIITAYSPQAKGRVERNHGVYQDRFIKELRLLGITTIPEADALLSNGFAEGFNRRIAVRQYLDGSVRPFLRDREPTFEEVPYRRPQVIEKTALKPPCKPRIPPPDHPWRTGYQRPVPIDIRPRVTTMRKDISKEL